jgi:hypothetical protein
MFALVVLGLSPAPAAADLTAFWAVSPTPSTHSGRGYAFGISLLVIGFEIEYASLAEGTEEFAPGLRTGMVNGLIQTPTRTQLYLTAGAGFFRERVGTEADTGIGTNIGGGVKFPLFGPLRARVDYRIFNLRGSPIAPTPKRFYVGANLAF